MFFFQPRRDRITGLHRNLYFECIAAVSAASLAFAGETPAVLLSMPARRQRYYYQCRRDASGTILFNPYGVVNLYIDFTTGFGLRPSPAAIIVMTPAGSGEIKLRRAKPHPTRSMVNRETMLKLVTHQRNQPQMAGMARPTRLTSWVTVRVIDRQVRF